MTNFKVMESSLIVWKINYTTSLKTWCMTCSEICQQINNTYYFAEVDFSAPFKLWSINFSSAFPNIAKTFDRAHLLLFRVVKAPIFALGASAPGARLDTNRLLLSQASALIDRLGPFQKHDNRWLCRDQHLSRTLDLPLNGAVDSFISFWLSILWKGVFFPFS